MFTILKKIGIPKACAIYVVSYMLKISYGIHLIIFVAQFVPTIYFHINRFDFSSDKLEEYVGYELKGIIKDFFTSCFYSNFKSPSISTEK